MKFSLILVLFWVLPTSVLAHGSATTRQQIVGDYKIEFEFNTSGTIFAESFVKYDTYLLNAKDDSLINFDASFMRFTRKDGTTFLAVTMPEAMEGKGYSTLSTIIEEPATYNVEISFYKDSKQLTEVNFDFEVSPDPTKKDNKIVIYTGFFLIGLILGGSSLWLFKKYA